MHSANADLTALTVPTDTASAPSLADLVGSLSAALDIQNLEPNAAHLVREIHEHAKAATALIHRQTARISQLEALSLTDELTGLLNRRGFQQTVQRTLDEARRHDHGGLLAYIDLDGFKAVNDTHGHDAGDAVLRAVANALSASVRSTDYVARLGGDEFAILFTHAEPLAGRARLTAICRELDGLSIDYKGATLTVGASMGIEAFGPGSRLEDLVARADKAMYRAKSRRKAQNKR